MLDFFSANSSNSRRIRRTRSGKLSPRKNTKHSSSAAALRLQGLDLRFALVSLVLILAALGLVAKLLHLQIMDGERGHQFLQDAGQARAERTVISVANRGMIVDRNGEPLAVSTPVESIWFDPRKLVQQPERWEALAVAAKVDAQLLAKKIDASKTREFAYLRRHLQPAQAQEILQLGIEGVYSRTEYKRYYPAAEVTSHLLGFTDIDDRGVAGMELVLNDELSGVDGAKRVLQDRVGGIIKNLGEIKHAQQGEDIQLSIDLRLQYLAYKELKLAVQKHRASSGSLVLMDARSGEVLAMVNQPSANPNNRAELKPAHTRNRAMTDVFEPGSTIKPFTMLAALESGQYAPSTMIDTHPGYFTVEGKLLRDHSNYGDLNVTEVLQKSSQVGTSKIALSLPAGSVRNVLQRFGLGEDLMTHFPGESAGLLPDYVRWHPLHTVTMSYGYGLAVTPLQLTHIYATLANDGQRVYPSLVVQDKVEPATRVAKAENTRLVRDMLESVIQPEGTGTRAAVANYRVAGKTGTSHRASGGSYDENRYTSLFAGFAPADEPRLVMAVVIEDPQGKDYYGGAVAAPVFSAVMGESLRLSAVPPDRALLAQSAKSALREQVVGR